MSFTWVYGFSGSQSSQRAQFAYATIKFANFLFFFCVTHGYYSYGTTKQSHQHVYFSLREVELIMLSACRVNSIQIHHKGSGVVYVLVTTEHTRKCGVYILFAWSRKLHQLNNQYIVLFCTVLREQDRKYKQCASSVLFVTLDSAQTQEKLHVEKLTWRHCDKLCFSGCLPHYLCSVR